MHPLQKTLGRELAEVAPDGVFRKTEILTERFGDNLAVALQDGEDVGFSLRRQHGCILHEFS